MESKEMVRYANLQWSHGYNQERHPRNSGGDGLAFFLWDGEPGDDLDNVCDDATDEENGGSLVGWVYVDSHGRVSAKFDEHFDEGFSGSLRNAFEWCEELNGLTDPEVSE